MLSGLQVTMSKEAIILRDMDLARQGVKNYLEGPNSDIDQIIRSIRENRWALSNKLLKVFPQLADPEMAAAIIDAVKQALGAQEDEPPLP